VYEAPAAVAPSNPTNQTVPLGGMDAPKKHKQLPTATSPMAKTYFGLLDIAPVTKPNTKTIKGVKLKRMLAKPIEVCWRFHAKQRIEIADATLRNQSSMALFENRSRLSLRTNGQTAKSESNDRQNVISVTGMRPDVEWTRNDMPPEQSADMTPAAMPIHLDPTTFCIVWNCIGRPDPA